MRILFLTENFPPESNASATRIFERALYWVKWGHEVTVLTSAPNFPEGKLFPGYENRWRQVEMMQGIRVVRVKTYIARNEGFAKRILDFTSYMCTAAFFGLFEKKPDVIVANSPQFFTAVAGWLLSAVRRVPFVFEVADLWPASIRAVGAMRDNVLLDWLEKLELFLYRRSSAVVALTRAFKEDLVSRGIHPGKIAVVINGVDLPRYNPRPRDEALEQSLALGGKFVVGYIGTHGMAHGLMNVIETADLLRHDDRIRFLFVGTGAERTDLMREAERRGLTNVVFVGRQPKEDMPRYWSLCNMALIHLKDDPVFRSVIPSKIFEAMGMGLPLIMVAPPGEGVDIVVREQAGIWVPAARPKDFADALTALRDSPTQVANLAAQSLAACPRYTRETQARHMIKVLEAVRDGRGGTDAERVADSL